MGEPQQTPERPIGEVAKDVVASDAAKTKGGRPGKQPGVALGGRSIRKTGVIAALVSVAVVAGGLGWSMSQPKQVSTGGSGPAVPGASAIGATTSRPTASVAVPAGFSLTPSPWVGFGTFSNGAGGCGVATSFSDYFLFTTPTPGTLRIEQPSTGDVATGPVAADGRFTMSSDKEKYEQGTLRESPGSVGGKDARARYSYVTRAGCTATYDAEFSLADPARNRAPVIQELRATRPASIPTATRYQVLFTDPDGFSIGLFRFRWTITNQCGTFTATDKSPIATWDHPHPPCADESVHPATITVTITDPHGAQSTISYRDGSAAGRATP